MMKDPDDYHAYYIDMPVRVRSLVSYDSDCYPSVFINSRLSRVEQKLALDHELRHIAGDDVFSGRPIRDVEGCAS